MVPDELIDNVSVEVEAYISPAEPDVPLVPDEPLVPDVPEKPL